MRQRLCGGGLADLAEAHRQSARRFGCGDVQPRALVHQCRDALPLGRLGRAEALHADTVAQRLAVRTGRDAMGWDGTGWDRTVFACVCAAAPECTQ